MMGEDFKRTMEDSQVDMDSSLKQCCRRQDPGRQQSIALERPSVRSGARM